MSIKHSAEKSGPGANGGRPKKEARRNTKVESVDRQRMGKPTFAELLRRMEREWKYGFDANDAGFFHRRIAKSTVERDLRDLLAALQDADLRGIVQWRTGKEATSRDVDADDIEMSAQLLARRFDKVWKFWTKLRRDLIARAKRRN